MSIHLADSRVYGHLWATDEARAILGEEARFGAWLDVLAMLAEAQAEVGLVPSEAAAGIRAHADLSLIDLDRVAAETRASGHSTLGLIRVLRSVLPEDAREWVYYGATVQDLTDTWTSLVMRRVGDLLERDLARIEAACLLLGQVHRDTPMLGRTHAQPGLPITFGFKVSVWAAEVRRHRRRLAEGRVRWELVQLGGALGTMEFWGSQAIPMLEAFGRRSGLGVPTIAWITSRDGVAEFTHLLAMAASTIAKIGNEIMELQRLEMGELREGFIAGTVGSITMPHKRNPEISEHLDTLARLVRSNAAVVTEGMVQLHERDGRAWKAEWIAVPEACAMTLAATGFAVTLLEGLEVMFERMAHNIDAQNGYIFSEPVMRALADIIGKHTAHDVVYAAAMNGFEAGVSLVDALQADPRVSGHLGRDQIEALLDVGKATGSAPAFVDRVAEALR
ncbi:MAG: adenylosuccinate lyase family protein [Acidimicrobiia bacterium]